MKKVVRRRKMRRRKKKESDVKPSDSDLNSPPFLIFT